MGVSLFPVGPTVNREAAYLKAIVKQILFPPWVIERYTNVHLKVDRLLLKISYVCWQFLMKIHLTPSNRKIGFKSASTGTRTLSKASFPLSTPLQPIFIPMSSIVTPGQMDMSSLRIRTKMAWIPSLRPPSRINWAKTMAHLAWTAELVIQYFWDRGSRCVYN